MLWVVRHGFAVALVVVALVSTGAFFILATPRYDPPGDTRLVKMANEDHYTGAEVRRAFAKEGLILFRRNRLSGIVFYGDKHPGERDDAFLVSLYPPTATVSFNTSGPKMLFDKRLANVEVSYGGHDQGFAARVALAVAELKH